MKRIVYFFCVMLVMTGVSFSQPAAQPASTAGGGQEDTGDRNKVLIDFGQYESKNAESDVYLKELPQDWEQTPTSYPVTLEDMDLNHWVVVFNSSSNTFNNRKDSYTKRVTTKKGETVLGARIHFPYHPHDSHAVILPLYRIMEFSKEGELVNVGNGVIDNVYQFKSVSVEVSGRNYKNRLTVNLVDQNGKMKSFFLGYLDFAGWRKLTWENPYYVSNVDQRALFKPPLYPLDKSYFKFHSFTVSRPYGGMTGDFVVYFKKVEVNYDLYFVDEDALTVDDEKVWGIHKRNQMILETIMRRRNSDYREIRNFELKRMGKNAETPAEKTEGKPATDATNS